MNDSDTPFAAYHDRIIALSGVFQALALVQQIARTGTVDTRPFSICIDSILRLDAPDTTAVFGELIEIQLGLKTLVTQLDSTKQSDIELARYWQGVLALEKKLSKNSEMLAHMSRIIGDWAGEVGTPHQRSDDVTAALGGLYRETLSTLTPRIMVSGEPLHLNDPLTAECIRSLLLAAIRSTILWRQMGGTRVGLMFSRSQLLGAGETLLSQLNGETLH
ncbi:MAG: high frequency lysogenization protein [Gammaproteobacteria bacterium]|jgi:high frequency lysogenization protein